MTRSTKAGRRTALGAVLRFHPQDLPAQFTDLEANGFYTGSRASPKQKAEWLAELREDAKRPFISEAYLYNLLGKEDARSLLARFRTLCLACGVDMDELYSDEDGQ